MLKMETMETKVISNFNLDDALFEAQQRCNWFIDGMNKTGLTVEIFKNISTERLCELYNIDINYFKIKINK